ncbi:hypothetical protein [Halanaerobacter jeridensis]|uniref:RiboL-PSP-HEPN domain-containing protein n=1 Tax=Halanaerobacter jeridensis TaxID=706427 RepID=A0A939BN45_9FIRM|nr:hypothetical protein [Halanaerobacter jeridensis]MBM7558155.1 hypothetical protein [Halanaerobacter jeridensis]
MSKDILNLPYSKELPEFYTDPLSDFYLRVRELVNYTGEIIVMAFNSDAYESIDIIEPEFNFETKDIESSLNIPQIKIISEKQKSLKEKMIKRLFYTSLTQLVGHYEKFLWELGWDIYYFNDILKKSKKKFTASRIAKFDNYDELKDDIICELLTNLMMKPYTKIVSQYESRFHIGIHKKAPISLEVVSNLIQLRHVIVHNEGHASKKYLTKMSNYDKEDIPKMLQKRYESVDIDFQWYFEMCKLLLDLGDHIDQQARKRWKTSADIGRCQLD